MLKTIPEIIIVVEGGCVVNVETAKPSLTYRLVDLDTEDYGDYEADGTNIKDIEKATKEWITNE